jgi:hypothetical protein
LSRAASSSVNPYTSFPLESLQIGTRGISGSRSGELCAEESESEPSSSCEDEEDSASFLSVLADFGEDSESDVSPLGAGRRRHGGGCDSLGWYSLSGSRYGLVNAGCHGGSRRDVLGFSPFGGCEVLRLLRSWPPPTSGLDPDPLGHLDLISARRRFGYQNGSTDRSSAGEKILERRIPSDGGSIVWRGGAIGGSREARKRKNFLFYMMRKNDLQGNWASRGG